MLKFKEKCFGILIKFSWFFQDCSFKLVANKNGILF